jgi:hypothetical protein
MLNNQINNCFQNLDHFRNVGTVLEIIYQVLR